MTISTTCCVDTVRSNGYPCAEPPQEPFSSVAPPTITPKVLVIEVSAAIRGMAATNARLPGSDTTLQKIVGDHFLACLHSGWSAFRLAMASRLLHQEPMTSAPSYMGSALSKRSLLLSERLHVNESHLPKLRSTH